MEHKTVNKACPISNRLQAIPNRMKKLTILQKSLICEVLKQAAQKLITYL